MNKHLHNLRKKYSYVGHHGYDLYTMKDMARFK